MSIASLQTVNFWLKRYRRVNWAVADQSVVSGVNFLTGVLLARALGIEEFGVFALAWMAVVLLSAVQGALIISPMMSVGPQQTEYPAPIYYGAVVVQQLVACILSFLLLLVAVKASALLFPNWKIEGFALPLAAAACAFQAQEFIRRYLFVQDKSALAFANDAVKYVGQLGLLLVLFQTHSLNIERALWVIAGISALAVAGGMFSLRQVKWEQAASLRVWKRNWQFSKWLVPSALMQFAAGNLFFIAAGSFVGVAAVGAMKAAANIMGMTHVLLLGLGNVVPRTAAWWYREGKLPALVAYLKKVALLIGLTTGIVALIAAIAPRFWFSLFFGPQFADYGYVLQWLALCYLVTSMVLPVQVGLQTLEYTRPIFTARLITTILSAVTVIPVVGSFGLLGALAGTLGSVLIFYGILAFALFHRIRNFDPSLPCDLAGQHGVTANRGRSASASGDKGL
ncbi:MAG TPA: hypothetical protein VFH31_00395 [Pyrinomonadaceae bacterium]|nr:hypothetical protein [Pyrinomonadaceae bacterium]